MNKKLLINYFPCSVFPQFKEKINIFRARNVLKYLYDEKEFMKYLTERSTEKLIKRMGTLAKK